MFNLFWNISLISGSFQRPLLGLFIISSASNGTTCERNSLMVPSNKTNWVRRSLVTLGKSCLHFENLLTGCSLKIFGEQVSSGSSLNISPNNFRKNLVSKWRRFLYADGWLEIRTRPAARIQNLLGGVHYILA
jgi:hypothetical protein